MRLSMLSRSDKTRSQSARRDDRAGGSADRKSVSTRQLAHELNSLLDGSRRCLKLAQKLLLADDNPSQPGTAKSVLDRLEIAQEGLNRMARLLERTLTTEDLQTQAFDQAQPIGSQLHKIMANLSSLADECGVNVALKVSEAATAVPIATLGQVIHNGLRNAIEACAASAHNVRRVEVAVSIESNELNIAITDSGDGLPVNHGASLAAKPGGHGLGLDLCRQIVEGLNGRLRLFNVPFGGGAIFQVVVPLRSVMRDE